MISPLFTTIVLVFGFIWVYVKVTTKSVGSGTRDLLEKELKANSVRRQPLNTLNYIDFKEGSIPITEPAPNPRIEELQNNLKALYSKKIVNLTGITNTDLKLTYGPANLPDLTEFDSNYTKLATNIYDLGIELMAEGLTDTAEAVLDYGVSIGSDISGNYIALANIYVERQQYSKINDLIGRANLIQSLTKASTISKLEQISDTHTTMVVHASATEPAAKDASPSAGDILEDVSADIDISDNDYKFNGSAAQKDPATDDSEDIPDNILPKDILDILG